MSSLELFILQLIQEDNERDPKKIAAYEQELRDLLNEFVREEKRK